MKAFKTNKWTYIFLLLASFALIAISFLVPFSDRWFSVISGIGGGCFASIVVAWLLDLVNCRIQNQKYGKLAKYAFGELRYAIADYCKQYCDYCCDVSSLDKNQMHNFQEWSDMYVAMISAGIPQANKSFTLETISAVRDAYQKFKSNSILFLDLNLVTEEEYKKMSEVAKRIIMMQMHYMISDVEINPNLIKEANDEISEILL